MKESNNKIPFGSKNGKMLDISEVESGLQCDCVCPACGNKLQARKGDKNTHHFSHDQSRNIPVCENALETSIHLMAKQILVEEGRVMLPGLCVKVSEYDDRGIQHDEESVVEEKGERVFDKVDKEKAIGNIRPDIIAYRGLKPLLIEVAVTHFTDKDKIRQIRKKGLHAIEIDLSKAERYLSKVDLRLLLTDQVDNKKWLSNPDAVKVKEHLLEKLSERIKAVNDKIKHTLKSSSRGKHVSSPKDNRFSQRPPLAPGHSTLAQTKEYDPRWFLCEACRNVWEVSLSEAPYTLLTIPCKQCGYEASAK